MILGIYITLLLRRLAYSTLLSDKVDVLLSLVTLCDLGNKEIVKELSLLYEKALFYDSIIEEKMRLSEEFVGFDSLVEERSKLREQIKKIEAKVLKELEKSVRLAGLTLTL